MPGYLAMATVVLLVILVMSRVFLMRRAGIKAMKFGEMDKRDFLIPPFALFYFYLIFATVLHWPHPGSELFANEALRWIGAAGCILGIILFSLSLIAFGKSFRVGIDEERPGSLVTTGVFAISRNPIYTAFGLILLGIFLIIPNWIILLYLVAGPWLIHRQVLREEKALMKIYGEAYMEYCKKVPRYL